MAVEGFTRGEQPVAERQWPRNSISGTANWHLGRPIVKPYSQQRKKNFPEMLDMRGEVSAEDEDVVHIHKIEWKVWSGIWSIKS